jgi:hypothetical protein
MPSLRSSSRRPFPALAIVGLIAVGGLVLAAPAFAASLSAKVTPYQITKGKIFTVKLTGAGDVVQSGVTQRVVAWTQANTPACASNANLEFARLRKNPVILRNITSQPFSITKRVTSGALGKRRVCAYLYNFGSASLPLARATTTYKVVLPLCHRGQTRGCRRH